MRAPVLTLAWEIWRRNYKYACLSLGTVPGYFLFYLAVRRQIHEPGLLAGLSFLWMLFSVFWVVAMFNYTENTPRKGWTGFPCRLFVLPVATVVLVSCPMFLAVAAMALVGLAWVKLVFAPLGISVPVWLAGVLAIDVACFQAIVWSLAGFRVTRTVVLAVAGLVALVWEGWTYAVLTRGPDFGNYLFWERVFMLVYPGLALSAFLGSWFAVAWQRRGGGRGRGRLKARCRAVIERAIDVLPRRRKAFASPLAAQCWFEWRQGGVLLPVCAGCVLLLLAGPVSWLNAPEMNGGAALAILVMILFMPLVLAFAIGKGFAKPDFWSMDLALKPFLAVRPLTAGEMVVTKMKVAAVSTLITWLLVLAAIPLWAVLWVDANTRKQIYDWRIWDFARSYYGPFSSYVMACLSVAVAMILTWRCLVGSLWAGLSGSWRHVVSAASVQVVAVVALLVAIPRTPALGSVQWQAMLEGAAWALAAAVIVKLWAGAIYWNKVTPQQLSARLVTRWLLVWAGGTVCLAALAWLIGSYVLWLKYLFVLVALLGVPLVRLGMAPFSLARNRHR